MKFNKRWLVVVLLLVSLQLAGCGNGGEVMAEEASPAKVEHLTEGQDASKIVLTEDAAQRIDLQTVKVALTNGGTKQSAIPYAAVLYDTEGKTWTYTNPEPLTYVRSPVTIDHMEGNAAVLKEGPTVGTPVVTVGAAELFGSESEFEEE